MKNKPILSGFYVLITTLNLIDCLQFYFGDCPVYYDEPCTSDTVKFILQTQINNQTRFYYLDPFNLYLPREFDIYKPLKILIYGYGGESLDQAIGNVSKAYETIGYNVILVNWDKLATIPCYATAYLNTWHVGQCIALLAVSLIPFGINLDSYHLVGFSLGAHIAGFAGNNIKEALGVKIKRITGLDPALPFFATMKKDWKLDPSDAKFVDVVHTSAGSFGKIEAAGHVDFYVNGGFLQPVCYNYPHPPLCSHVMSGIYFAESITGNKSFVGRQCENVANYLLGFCSKRKKAIMGEFLDLGTRGNFFVDTAKTSPFALG